MSDTLEIEVPVGGMHTPEPELIEDMMARARMYDRAEFDRLADEFYRRCQC